MFENRNEIVRFGAHEFDLKARELRRSGLRLRLQPQPAQLLALLIRRAGEIVTREEIRRDLWSDDTLVDFEQGINHSIRQIRTVLGDDAVSGRFIETVPRVGYRFFSEVVALSTGTGIPGAGPPERPAATVGSTVPPADGSGTVPPRAFFGRGMRPSIATGLLGLFAILLVFLGMQPARRAEARTARAFQRMTLTELTGPESVWAAAISPDGGRLAYARGEEGGFALALRSLATDATMQLVGPLDTPIRAVTFSPDGSSLYFVRQEKRASGYSSLYRVPALGGAARKLIFDVDHGVAFHPDGRRLAFVRGDPGRSESALVLAGSDGIEERIVRVARMPVMYPAITPAWSPDGERVALVRTEVGGAARVTVIDPDTGDETSVGEKGWDRISALAWLPTGEALLLAAEAPATEDRPQLWQLTYPSGKATRVTNDLSSYVGLSLIPDGRSAVAVRRERSGNVWTVSPDRAVARNWTWGTDTRDRVLSLRHAAGDSVLYSTLDRDHHRLWRMNRAGARTPVLPDGIDGAEVFTTSPDGRTIVYAAPGEDGLSHIFRVSASGGMPEQITAGSGERSPAACPGGQVVFFAHVAEAGIWRWTESDGASRKISDLVPYGAPVECSPDGSQIALATFLPGHVDRQLVVLSAEEGEPRSVHPWNDGWSLRWAPDGEALTYVRDRKGPDIWRMSLTTGESQRLTRLGPGAIFSFDWSADGTRLHLLRGSVHTSAVLISNFL